jgi:hypothetical protein
MMHHSQQFARHDSIARVRIGSFPHFNNLTGLYGKSEGYLSYALPTQSNRVLGNHLQAGGDSPTWQS